LWNISLAQKRFGVAGKTYLCWWVGRPPAFLCQHKWPFVLAGGSRPPAQIVSLLAGILSRPPVQIGICARGCLKEPSGQIDSVLADRLTNPPAQRFFLCYNFIFCQFKFKFISH